MQRDASPRSLNWIMVFLRPKKERHSEERPILIPRSIERVSNVCFWPLAEHHGRQIWCRLSGKQTSNCLRAAIREQSFVQRVSGTLLPEFLDGLARAAVPCFERIRKVIWIRTRIEQKRYLKRRQTKHAMLKLHGRNTRKRVVLFANERRS